MTKKVDEMNEAELTAYETFLNEALRRNKSDDDAKLDARRAELIRMESAYQEEYYQEHPEERPRSKLPESGERKNDTNDGSAFYNSYMKKHESKGFKSKSGYIHTMKEATEDLTFQIREDQEDKEMSFGELYGNASSDTGCIDQPSDWSPADNYSSIIWNVGICKADLFRVAVKGVSVDPGAGLGIQIRAFGAMGDPTSLAACECASCASITWVTYPLTLSQYALQSIVCNWHEFDVGKTGTLLQESYIKSMSDSYARFFDEQIYAKLHDATPGTTEQLPVDLNCTASVGGSCCSDVSQINLVNAINSLIASMREGTGLTAGAVNPDYLILSPSVASVLKRFNTPTAPAWFRDIIFDDEGRLSRWGGLNVIEYCSATSCTDLADAVVAIVLDSSQAVLAGFGKKPFLYKFLETGCNSVKLTMWSYFGSAIANTDYLGHVINAS